MKKISILLMFFTIISCSNSNQTSLESLNTQRITAFSNLEGTWILKNVLMGDALDAPCGFMNEGKVKEMNVTFTSEKLTETECMKLYGQSSVNEFMGGYTILSYDAATKTGKIKFESLFSTKMASVDPNFMDCENRYFSYLEKAEDFKIENGKLQLSKTYRLAYDNAGNSPFDNIYNNVLYFDKK